MTGIHEILAIFVMALVTYLLRAIPFFAFRNRSVPKYIEYLGKYLPYSVMALLVVYCLKGIKISEGSHGIPELLATLSVVLLHIWKKNTILSVVAGTTVYMCLIRFLA